jgi:hypothetical protein
MPRNLLRDPWWKRILAGDTTAVPPEWETPEGKISLRGEAAEEFIAILETEGVKASPELMEACREYRVRRVIEETGRHPNSTAEWNDTYREKKRK